MNETRLSDALLLESTPPWWVLIVVAVGILIMVPGLLHYFGRGFSSLPASPLVFILTGGFFALFPLIFLLAHETLVLEINQPPGSITIRDSVSRVELPASEFHSLYIASVRNENGVDYRLYLRRPGGRNFFIDEYDSMEDTLRRADPISALIGLPIQKAGDEKQKPAATAGRARPGTTASAPVELAANEGQAAQSHPNLRTLQTEHGMVYYWDHRQYWMILPVIAWAGIVYLLIFILPARRGWSAGLILFQVIFSAILLVLLLALPLSLFGKQCVLPGKNSLHVWQDLGGYRIRESSIAYERIEFFQHVMNDSSDPFLTLIAGKEVKRIQDLTRETRDVIREHERMPDVQLGGINPFMIPAYIDLIESFGSLGLPRMIQLDPRGLSVAEQTLLEDAIFNHLPADRKRAASDPDFIARKMQEALLQQF